MAYKEKEVDRIGQLRWASRMRRNARDRRDRQENESLLDTGSPMAITSPTTEEINSNSRDAERLRKSREQVKKGEIHWGLEDEETSKSDAGE